MKKIVLCCVIVTIMTLLPVVVFAQKTITFTWLINKVEVQNQLEQIAEMYMSQHPNVKIITEVAGGSVEPYNTRLKAKMGSTDKPAIFAIEGPNDIQTFSSYVKDLSQEPIVKEIMPGLLDNVTTTDGKVWALPMSVEGYGIIYNKDIFKKAGIDPSQVNSFQALKAATEKLDSMKTDLELDSVFSFPAKETWIIGSHMSTAFLNGEFKTPMEAWASKTVSLKYWGSLKQFVDLQVQYSLKKGQTKNSLLNTTYSDQIEASFALGKVAMVHNGSWIAPILAETAPEMIKGDHIGILPLPIEGYKTDSIVVGGTPYVAFNTALPADVQIAALDFYYWMYTDNKALSYVLSDLQFIPPFKGTDINSLANPLARELLRYMKNGKTLMMMYLGTPPGWKSYAGEKIQEYLLGRSWADCEKDLKDMWASLSLNK